MKINNKKLIVIIVIFIAIISFLFIKVIKITSDYSSSGGTERKLETNLIFFNNILVSGSQSYIVTPGSTCSGNPGDCGSKSECIAENQQWVDSVNKGVCNISSYIGNIPLTKQGIEEQIKSGVIKPMNSSCTHGDLCYKIIPL